MQAPTPNTPTQATTGRPNRFRADRKGSAIILVIVSIVLMAILGATFVQVTRFERIDQGGEHIDIAINSILNEVAVVLGQDLYDDNGNFFNPDGSPLTDGGGDEPYDYPWTNSAVAARPVVFVNGTGGTAEGGVNDDPWLCVSAVDNANEWAHVSDLTGRRLDVNNRDLTLLGQNNPGEQASTAAFFENINVTDLRLVDADGDGIGDSLWAYAPAAEIAGKRYVYAIRIVDLSGRVNINTALGQVDTGGNIVANPRGDSPTEVDGAAVAAVYGAAAGTTPATAVNEFNDTIARRYGGAATVPVAWGDATNERRHFWLNGASLVGAGLTNLGTDPAYDPNDLYGQGDLFELLYRNGLNSTTTSQLENDMPNLLRAGATEFTFADTPTAAMNADAHAFMTNNARVMFTGASGAMAVAPSLGPTVPLSMQTAANERVLRVDINHSPILDLGTVIAETIGANGTFNFAAFTHVPNATEFASQLAANIVDMRDPDNQLTNFNAHWGMEALPFISEVYVQRRYNNVTTTGPNAPANDYSHDFTGGNPIDYMIEIRNPFHHPISLENVYLTVNGNAFGGTAGELSTHAGVPADNMLQPGAVMILYRNGTAGEDMLNTYTAGPDDILVELTTENWPANVSPVVGLRAEVQSTGAMATWNYCEVTAAGVKNLANGYRVPNSNDPAPLPGGPNAGFYIQHSYHGTTGFNMLQCEEADYFAQTNEPDNAYDGSLNEAGTASKVGEPTVAGGQFAGDWNGGDMQWLFLDKETAPGDPDGRIPYVADILSIPVVGPNDFGAANTTLATAIASSGVTRIDQLMLDYTAAAASVDNTRPALNVPHAVLLLDRLTTHSPTVDGIDLDGDGVDVAVGGPADLDEVFVPGTLNLNTADQSVLAAALPFRTPAQRNAVAARIVDFRENFTTRPATARTTAEPGIAYTGELYELLTADLNGLNPQPDWNNHQVGGATDDPYLGNPEDPNADNVTGDREEDLMLAKWLNEVCSTRSDVFAVYMVVQGFPAGNFGAGAVESARVVAVFSRANVRQTGDKAQLIAVRRVE